ncbi:unnamed protein product [Brassica rapa]|uniref:NYN domain-containing protein n=1 Tax=Brassica campestris TaxID=3711 RepID=A0A3P5ZDA0_BRACM|nr:unnamed protein product [Brassica rapa]VDC73644.1 unnamed protein product [Brassica rapa]
MSALNRTLSSSMSLKLNTPTPFPILAFPNSKPSEIRFSNRWGQRKVERSLSHSLTLLDHQSCTRRRDHQIRCGGGGGDLHHVLETAVWWDLNTCPVPAGVDPRCVRACIESALEKQIGHRSAVSIYAMGNLEYISSDLLQNISSSGIILTHAPFGVHDLYEFLDEWSDDELKKKTYPPNYIMMISGDYDMLYPQRFRCYGFTNFVAYPENVPVAAPLDELSLLAEEFDKVFAKEFVWETLLSDNLGETLLLSDEKPLCICNICNDVYQVCDEFITHLKSEEHRNQALKQAACIDRHGKPKYFCQVCNYPVYGEYLLFVHNESEEHIRKACFTRWKEAKDKEEKKKVFTEFIAKKVKPSKLDDVTMSTGIASPPAAMAANRAGENVPQLKFIKLIPDVIFVLTVTILAIVSAKLSRRMYLK